MGDGSVEIVLAAVRTAEELHDLLATGLGFPSYSGKNRDAFRDVIVSEDVLPRLLILRGCAEPERERELPREAGLLCQCVDEYAGERPDRPCRVVFD